MKVTFARITSNFYVMIPKTQRDGLLLTKSYFDPKVVEQMGPLYDYIFKSNTQVFNVNKETFLKMGGKTAFVSNAKTVISEGKHDLKRHVHCAARSTRNNNNGDLVEGLPDDYEDDEVEWLSSDDDDEDYVDGEDLIAVIKKYDPQYIEQNEDGVIVRADEGMYSNAILVWLMANATMWSLSLGGLTNVKEAWVNSGSMLPSMNLVREFFMVPYDYFSGIHDQVTRILPRIESIDTGMTDFLSSNFEKFPTLVNLDAKDVFEIYGGDMFTVPGDMREQVKMAVNEYVSTLPQAEVASVAKYINTLQSKMAHPDDPSTLIRYSKMWAHFKPVNLLRTSSMFIYNTLTLEQIKILGTSIQGVADIGFEKSAEVIATFIPPEAFETTETLASHLEQYTGIMSARMIAKVIENGKEGVKRGKEYLQTEEAQNVMKTITEAAESRFQQGANRTGEFTNRMIEALTLFMSSSIVLTLLTVYKMMNLMFNIRKREIINIRTTRQKVAKFVLNALDFINLGLICFHSFLELTAMVGVLENHYKYDEIIGTKSHYQFYTMTSIQFALNYAIMENFDIKDTTFSHGVMYLHNRALLVFNKMSAGQMPSSQMVISSTLSAISVPKSVGKFTYRQIQNVGTVGVSIYKRFNRAKYEELEDDIKELQEREMSGSWAGTSSLFKRVDKKL